MPRGKIGAGRGNKNPTPAEHFPPATIAAYRKLAIGELLNPARMQDLTSIIEAQTVESTIRAYGAGEIEIPEIDPKTNQKHLRYALHEDGEHAYTVNSVAAFLGWLKTDGQANHACRVAFEMLDAIAPPASNRGRRTVQVEGFRLKVIRSERQTPINTSGLLK